MPWLLKPTHPKPGKLPVKLFKQHLRSVLLSVPKLELYEIPEKLGKTMTPELKERIDNLVKQNKILVFMKGNKLMPQCGFSNNVVQILNTLGVPYETIDILEDSELRQGIKEYSNWPTIPQVYINGEFVGGSDVLIELYQQGELQQLVEVALAS
jgi:monothiol glutaredoxin